MNNLIERKCGCGNVFQRRKGEKESAWVMRKKCDNCGQTHWREVKGHDRRTSK